MNNIKNSSLKIISTNKRKKFSLLLLIAGICGLLLTYGFTILSYHNTYTVGFSEKDVFNGFPVVYYYVFNSSLLILLSVFLYKKLFKIYSVFSFILTISVLFSLFVIGVKSNLFIFTIIYGITMGYSFGGPLLVPLFLYTVFKSFFDNMKVYMNKLAYEDIESDNNVEHSKS